MTVVAHVPGPLLAFTAGQRHVVLPGRPATAGEALDALFACHPGVRDRVVDEQGRVRRHVNVFVGSDNIRDVDGLRTPVRGDDDVHILANVSGG